MQDSLHLRAEEPAGLVYVTPGGAWFRLYRTPYAGTAQHTIAGWEVEDLEAEVAELKARGVAFQEYHSGQLQTVDGIATTGLLRVTPAVYPPADCPLCRQGISLETIGRAGSTIYGIH